MTNRRPSIEKTCRSIGYLSIQNELHCIRVRRLLHLPNRKAHPDTPQSSSIISYIPFSQYKRRSFSDFCKIFLVYFNS